MLINSLSTTGSIAANLCASELVRISIGSSKSGSSNLLSFTHNELPDEAIVPKDFKPNSGSRTVELAVYIGEAPMPRVEPPLTLPPTIWSMGTVLSCCPRSLSSFSHSSLFSLLFSHD